MAQKVGSVGKFYRDGGTTQLEEVVDVTFDTSTTMVDITTNDSNSGGKGYKEYLPGDVDGTVTVTMHLDTIAGPQQVLLLAAYFAQSSASYVFAPHGSTTGFLKLTFSGFVKSVSSTMTHEKVVEFKAVIQITGLITSTVW